MSSLKSSAQSSNTMGQAVKLWFRQWAWTSPIYQGGCKATNRSTRSRVGDFPARPKWTPSSTTLAFKKRTPPRREGCAKSLGRWRTWLPGFQNGIPAVGEAKPRAAWKPSSTALLQRRRGRKNQRIPEGQSPAPRRKMLRPSPDGSWSTHCSPRSVRSVRLLQLFIFCLQRIRRRLLHRR